MSAEGSLDTPAGRHDGTISTVAEGFSGVGIDFFDTL